MTAPSRCGGAACTAESQPRAADLVGAGAARRVARLQSRDQDRALHLVVVVAIAHQRIEVEGAWIETGIERAIVAVAGRPADGDVDPLVARRIAQRRTDHDAGID